MAQVASSLHNTADLFRDLRNACQRERRFQDQMTHKLKLVHEVLDDKELSADEKYVILTTELKYGKQRAQELCYGQRRSDWK